MCTEDEKNETVVKSFRNYYLSRKLTVSERVELLNLQQRSDESANFYPELRKATDSCEYEEVKDIRDTVVAMAFLSGLISDETWTSSLEEKSLSFKDVLDLTESFETIRQKRPHWAENSIMVFLAVGAKFTQKTETMRKF
ncbi:hypothetical protein AB6A40_000131 [Gnathostoma spinigerum]|uniref:Uncharacterized protein n=1 Tax=Gnathostoma spinigerum TaxID=75299 RepID=A0ABD6E3J9_9BILA